MVRQAHHERVYERRYQQGKDALQYNLGMEVEMVDFAELGSETVDIWERNADFWDERIGEGNAFHRQPQMRPDLNILKQFVR